MVNHIYGHFENSETWPLPVYHSHGKRGRKDYHGSGGTLIRRDIEIHLSGTMPEHSKEMHGIKDLQQSPCRPEQIIESKHSVRYVV